MRKILFKRNERSRQSKRAQKGMQLIETAFVMPVMMILLMGLVELSYYFYTYATLARATRAGAGYIYSKAYTATEIANAKNMVVCGEVSSCSGYAAVVSGLSAANVDIQQVAANGTDKNITVKIINYSYTPYFNLFSISNGGIKSWDTTTTKINAATTMRYIGDR